MTNTPQPIVAAPEALPLNLESLVRLTLGAVGGILIQDGLITQSAWSYISGGLVLLATLAWILTKNKQHVLDLIAAITAAPATVVDSSGNIILPPAK